MTNREKIIEKIYWELLDRGADADDLRLARWAEELGMEYDADTGDEEAPS